MEANVETPTQLSTKVVAPKIIFYKEGTTTLARIHEYADRVVPALMQEAENRKLLPAGPLEFIYFGCTGDMEQEFRLQIALPVEEQKAGAGEFSFRQTDSFYCLHHDYAGDVNQMFPVYEMLYRQLAQKQWQPSDEVREVYKQWEHLTSANNLTEIQIGLQ